MKGKKPIALELTDTHLKLDNIDLVTAIWQQAVIKCKELDIQIILFLGDFFTSRNAQPLDVLEEGADIMQMVKDEGIALFAIPGNHDKVDLDSERSYLNRYRSECNVIRESFAKDLHNVTVHFIPYFKENGKYQEHLERCAGWVIMKRRTSKNKHILFTHIAINGVKNNDGTLVDKGVDPNLFGVFDAVHVGHYHNQSKVGKNIYYIGSAYQANFGEDNQKGFTILYDDGSHEFVKSEFPEYVKLKVDISDEKQLKVIQKKYANSQENVRIVFTGDKTQLQAINKEKLNAIGIDVKFDNEIVRQDLSAVVKSNSTFDRSNIAEAFSHFCTLNEYKDVEVGLEYLKQII